VSSTASSDAEPRRAAAFDIGSNTVKFTAAELGAGREIVPLAQDASVTRLSGDTEPGTPLDAGALERTIDALRTMHETVCELGIRDIRAVATAGLRRASNPDAFLARAERDLGLSVRIIDGRTEAELAFVGATSARFGPRSPEAPADPPGGLLVVDIGGRSTELAVGSSGRVSAFASLDVGTLSLAERTGALDGGSGVVDAETLEKTRQAVRGHLSEVPRVPESVRFIGVSGTVLAIAGRSRGIELMRDLLPCAEDRTLSIDEIERQLDELSALSNAERVYGDILPPGRADVIVPGVVLLLELMRHVGSTELCVTGRGLRFGLLRQQLGV